MPRPRTNDKYMNTCELSVCHQKMADLFLLDKVQNSNVTKGIVPIPQDVFRRQEDVQTLVYTTQLSIIIFDKYVD